MSRVLLVLCLLFASAAHADSITASVSGCVSSLPDGASWVGTDYLFMAFHSPEQGCAPTIENPTRGLFIESTTPEGLFRVDVLAKWLPTCGRAQFDAQMRLPGGGLDPTVHALVFDTGVDCVPRSGAGLIPFTDLPRGGTVDNWPPLQEPPQVQPPGPPHVVEPPVTTVPVPDRSSSLLFCLLAIGCLRWAR